MQIRRYRDGDIEKIDIQDEQIHEIEASSFELGNCFTAEIDGVVIGVFGCFEMTKSRGVVFSFISQKASKYMLRLVRKLRFLIDSGMSKTAIDRLEMQVMEGFEHGERFAEMLGFECEGVMRKYYKGRNYKLYARVR